MRFLLRVIGVVLVAAGFVALVVDGARSIASNEIVMTELGRALFMLDPGALNGAQAAVQRYVAPWLWDPAAIWVLAQPTFAVLGVLGLLFLLLGRRGRSRRRLSSR